MKKVGLTPRLMENSNYHEVREVWDVNWSRFVIAIGYIPVLLSVNYSEQHLINLDLNAVIFTGGNDLAAINDNELSRARDSYESLVLEFSLKNKLPIIGVCRGMQFFAHYYGESLEKVQGHIATRHRLIQIENSPYYEQLSEIYDVNSYHNFGLKIVNGNWNVLATSPDGVVKAIIHQKEKILAHMWHPEREEPFDKAQMNLIKQFIKEETK